MSVQDLAKSSQWMLLDIQSTLLSKLLSKITKGAVNFRVREAKLLAIRSVLKIESLFFDMLDTLWASLSIPIPSQIGEH